MILTPAFEKYENCVAEAVILNAKHWIELYGKTGYRANHGGMVDWERAGGFVYFTLRDEQSVLAGHAAFTITNSPIYGKVIAIDSFYYVLPEYRGHIGMTRLLQFAAEYLTAHGVEQVMVGHKTNQDLASIIQRAGFVKSSTLYSFKR